MSHPAASVSATTAFFASSEQAHFARQWAAGYVDELRNPGAMEEYPLSNAQALKLRKLFAATAEQGGTKFTFGVVDAIMANEMGEAGFETMYQSGANATLAEVPTFDCGGDLADYTYDTVPNRVKQIVRNQQHWARVDTVRGRAGKVDRLVPIIADGDSGHGNSTATMKMVKLFLEAGVAGIHIDDMQSGEKNFSVGSLTHVMVPTSEHIRRLLSAKLQMDISGSHCVLIARTDSESASRITSTIDPADRPFILGRTNLSLPSLSKVLSGSKTTGADRVAEEIAWEEASKLTTLDKAVAAVLSGSELEEWKSASAGLNTSDALIKAQELGIKVVWDAEGCRNLRGWYRYKGGIDAAIARSIAFAPYSDMLWSCAPAYNFDEIVKLEKEVHAAVPGKWLGYNWSFGYFTDKPESYAEGLVKAVGDLGFIWQFNPMAGFTASGVGLSRFAKDMHEQGMLAYRNMIAEGLREK